MLKRVENSHIWQREEFEHYVEPEWCSQRLFAEEKFRGPVFDPFCGFGRIVIAARAAGYAAQGADIIDRGFEGTLIADFLQNKFESWNGDIVGNPPFDEFQNFALHALKVSRGKIALIWLMRTLPAARWLRKTPLKRILLLTPRPSMPPGHVITAGEKPGGGKQDFCWLIWDHEFSGSPTIGWLQRDSQSTDRI